MATPQDLVNADRNLGTLDEVINSDDESVVTRTGKEILTIQGAMKSIRDSESMVGSAASGAIVSINQAEADVQQELQDAIARTGYNFIGEFTDGGTLESRVDILRFDGEWYRWDGSMPKTVPAGSTPQDEGGIGSGAWLSVGDAAFRQQLGETDSDVLIAGRTAEKTASKLAFRNAKMKARLTGNFHIVAHRGRSVNFDKPENSISALNKLPGYVKAVEFDTHITSDGVPVLMHDSTVNRTTNGTGLVSELTLAQIKNLQLSDGSKVPTLSEYIDSCRLKGIRYLLMDMKDQSDAQSTEIYFDVVKERNALDYVIFMYTTNGGGIRLRNLPEPVLAARFGVETQSQVDEAADVTNAVLTGIKPSIPYDQDIINLFKYMKERELVTSGSTTNLPDDFEIAVTQAGCDMILTDYPDNFWRFSEK